MNPLRRLTSRGPALPCSEPGSLRTRTVQRRRYRHGEQADIDGLPYRYRAEHYFTHVAVALALNRLEEAEEAAAAGADAAVRASSERNVLFLLARVAASQRDWARADSLCEAAAEHRYRGQGGDGLLLWGDVLTELGRPGPARRAYELAISRDSQSESATKAAARLGLSEIPLPSRNGEGRRRNFS